MEVLVILRNYEGVPRRQVRAEACVGVHEGVVPIAGQPVTVVLRVPSRGIPWGRENHFILKRELK